MVLAHEPGSAALARHGVLAAAQGAEISSQVAQDAALVLSELVGNAVKHGRPLPDRGIEVGWAIVRGGVVVRVTDGGGSGLPALREPPSSSTGGRGLWLVDRVAADWGVHRNAAHTTVWAELRAATTQRETRRATATG